MLMGASSEGIDRLTERLSLLGTSSEEKDEIYIKVFTELGEVLKRRLRLRTPRGVSGQLATSTDFRIIVGDTEQTGEREYRLEMIQTADNSGFIYRPIVVSGRLPGKMPPMLALRGWVQLRWGLNTVQATRGAYRLARHIAAHGTQPNTYTNRVIRESQGDIDAAADQLGQELNIFIRDF